MTPKALAVVHRVVNRTMRVVSRVVRMVGRMVRRMMNGVVHRVVGLRKRDRADEEKRKYQGNFHFVTFLTAARYNINCAPNNTICEILFNGWLAPR